MMLITEEAIYDIDVNGYSSHRPLRLIGSCKSRWRRGERRRQTTGLCTKGRESLGRVVAIALRANRRDAVLGPPHEAFKCRETIGALIFKYWHGVFLVMCLVPGVVVYK